MENNEQNKKKIDKSRPLVEILNLTKEYKNKLALDKVNLTINPGDRIGIIGANGNGKSTLSEIIGAIRKPTSGEIIRQEHLVNVYNFKNLDIRPEYLLWIWLNTIYILLIFQWKKMNY